MNTPTPPARCEPPAGTGDGTWHWIAHRDGTSRLLRWDSKGWRTVGIEHPVSSTLLTLDGYAYLAPVTPPAEVAALRERVRVLERALRWVADLDDESAINASAHARCIVAAIRAAAVQS